MNAQAFSGLELLILDVDGTIRWTRRPGAQYPCRSGEWALFPGVRERLAAFDFGPGRTRLAVASNQSGVALGHLSRAMARSLILEALEAALGRSPEEVRVEMCTCPPGAPCPRQKPRPGLLRAALAWAGAAPTRALFVGDLEIDRLAAEAAGVPLRRLGLFRAVSPLGTRRRAQRGDMSRRP